MRFSAIVFISVLFFSCGNSDSGKPVATHDSVSKKDSAKDVAMKIPIDSLKKIDSAVAEIRREIAKGELRKKAMKGNAGSNEGFIYELFENDTALKYLYCDNGMEFGSSEIECFFQNGLPVFSIRNRIKFMKNSSGEIDPSLRNKTAAESTYFSGGKIIEQNTQAFTNEAGWKKIAFQNQLLKIIDDIQADLIRNGAWVKK